jgi:hypothetical protein
MEKSKTDPIGYKMSPRLGACLSVFFVSAVFADPAAGPSASTINASGHQSCKANSTDIAVPVTGADIQDIVTRYLTTTPCNRRTADALESIFRDEQRNEAWAGPLERIVKEAALVHGAKMVGVCHTSLCRFDIELTPSVESARSPHALEYQVIDATSGTPLQVASIQKYGSNFKFTIYFYSTFVPAAFVEPLRSFMETGSTLSNRK